MSDESGQHRSDLGGTDRMLIGGGVLLVLGLLAAAVALGLAGWKPASIVGLLTGLGTVAGGLLAALSRLTTLTRKVDQVAHQTNGALRSFVSAEVDQKMRKALTDHGMPAQGVPRTRKRGGNLPPG
jgi:hypothetical protein